jgi:hypothetical protein
MIADALVKDAEAEKAGVLEIRRDCGARDDETFAVFIRRLIRERDEAKVVLAVTAPPPARSERERLPEMRDGHTRHFHLVGAPHSYACPKCQHQWEEPNEVKCYFTLNRYPDGRPGEAFIVADRAGSTARGALDAVAIAVSIGIQHGVPLGIYLDKFVAMRFGHAGATKSADFPRTCSLLDLWARWARSICEAPKVET